MEPKLAKELTYPLPRFLRSFGAALFDLFTLFTIGMALLFASQQIMRGTPHYQELRSVETTLRLDSRLYIEDNGVLTLDEYLQSKELTRKEQSEFYECRLDYFFEEFLNEAPSLNGAERYFSDKHKASFNDQPLFDEKGHRISDHTDLDGAYLSFFEEEYSSVALGYLREFPAYWENAKDMLGLSLLYGFLSFSIAHILVYLVVPFCFIRGKKTLGMFFAHLSYVEASGLSLPWHKHLFHWFFQFVFIFWGSILAFLLPLALSIGMSMLRKDHQNLGDYLFNIHMIDDQNQKVFRTSLEVAASEYENR